MSPMGGRGAAVVAAVSSVLLAATGATAVLVPVPYDHVVSDVLPNVALALVLPAFGALVLRRLPGHPLGHLWLLTGLAATLTLAVHTYAQVATDLRPGTLPLGTASAWVASWFWVLGATPLLTLGLLLFPTGRLPGPRWRPALFLVGAAVVLPVLGQALAPGPLEELPVDNPIGMARLAAELEVVRGLGFLAFTAAVALGAASVVVRYVRGSASEREQVALPACAAALLAATFLVPAVGPLRPWLDALAVVEVVLLLASFAVAVLRDRAIGAEVVVSRSLTYGLLTGTVAVGYALTVAVLSELVDDPSAGLAASVVTALAVLPLRDRLQSLVSHVVYGERADPFAALDRLHQRLDGAADPAAVLDSLAGAVASVLRLPAVRVLLAASENGGDEVIAAAVGAAASWHRVPLRHGDEDVGALLVAPRGGQAALDPADLRMLDALRPQAAAAVAAMRLATALHLSRQRIVAAREEERRRLRRDLHDGLGPTLAGIGLGLEVARASADPATVDKLLAELTQEAANAVVDVRRLVEDLRPATLDELGLVGALREHADRVSRRDGCHVEVEGPQQARLPAAVEVAAYRIAMEALTNALRHGAPQSCRLSLEVGDELVLCVSDDGNGDGGDRPAGVGLGAMRERADELGGTLVVESRRGVGTTVVARIPLRSGA